MAFIIPFFIIVISVWFYNDAKKVGKNKSLWFCIGLFTCLALGILFKKFGELYILPNTNSLADVLKNKNLQFYYEVATMIIISAYAYMIHYFFLSKNKSKK